MRGEGTQIGSGLDTASQRSLRRIVIRCILDTDMVHHGDRTARFEHINKYGTKNEQRDDIVCKRIYIYIYIWPASIWYLFKLTLIEWTPGLLGCTLPGLLECWLAGRKFTEWFLEDLV